MYIQSYQGKTLGGVDLTLFHMGDCTRHQIVFFPLGMQQDHKIW